MAKAMNSQKGTTGEFTPKVVVREFLGLMFMPQIISCFGNATFFLGLWPGQFWIFEFFTSQRRNDCDWLC